VTTLTADRPRRSWINVSGAQGRAHAVLAACVLWAVSLAVTIGGTGSTNLVGVTNAPDFVQFYTLGRLAADHRIGEAYDFTAFHDAQAALVPESQELIFPPVYPPQVALLFAPLSRLPYHAALRLWTTLTIIGYALIVWRTWWLYRDRFRDPVLLFAAAAAFPPFFQTVIYGQVTLLVLVPCFLAWRALERRQHVLAGFALGLLAVKPQFGPVFAVIVLMRRDWRMLLGALAAVAWQLSMVWIVLGHEVFGSYLSVLQTVTAHADALEAKPFQSHSVRALTRLLPGYLGTACWLLVSATVLWRAGRAWCSSAPVSIRLGIAILAAVLVNPHLIVYDAAILVLPLMWFAAGILGGTNDGDALWYTRLLYGLFLAFFVPTAALITVQLSVLLMLWLFWRQSGAARWPRAARAWID
jgi:hypothetical protein